MDTTLTERAENGGPAVRALAVELTNSVERYYRSYYEDNPEYMALLVKTTLTGFLVVLADVAQAQAESIAR